MRIGHGFDVHAFEELAQLSLVVCASRMKKDCWRILMVTWRYTR